jgi:hypothetical protein
MKIMELQREKKIGVLTYFAKLKLMLEKCGVLSNPESFSAVSLVCR